MFSARKLLGAGLVICLSVIPLERLWGQVDPMVQVFTSANSGSGDVAVPLWRLPIDITTSLSTGYDDNVNTLPSNAQGSWFVSPGLDANYNFGTSRTLGNLHGGANVTFYPEVSSDYDPNAFLDLSLMHQVNLRLTLSVLIHASYQAEPNFDSATGLDRRVGNYFSSTDSITASYQWLPRFSTITRYSFGLLRYDDRIVAQSQNQMDHTFAQSFRFLYLPVTAVSAEYRYAFVEYDDPARGSHTNSILGGIEHTFSSRLEGKLHAGIDFRSTTSDIPEDSSSSLSPNVEGSLSYVLGGKTMLHWNVTYNTENSNVPTSPGRLTLRTTLGLTYAFTARLTSTLNCTYSHDDNEGSEQVNSFTQDSLDVGLNLNYAINRFLSANVGYNRTQVSSDLAFQAYSRNRYFTGLSILF